MMVHIVHTICEDLKKRESSFIAWRFCSGLSTEQFGRIYPAPQNPALPVPHNVLSRSLYMRLVPCGALPYSTGGIMFADYKIAVLVPCYNEEATVQNVVRGFLQEYGRRKDEAGRTL